MVYLNETAHGGTAFFRHRSTGFETLTAARYPTYEAQLKRDVAETGLPPSHYVTDGAPHFECIYTSESTYNSAILYQGNAFHSGVIQDDAPLSPDPAIGRLTVNGFFRPVTPGQNG